MPKLPLWQIIMLLIGAAGYVAQFVGAPPVLIFVLAAVGLIPLAGLIGHGTEELAHYIGPKWGGLLNATFGNMAELIIAGVALSAGLYDLVKASITGSIIGNLLLVLGAGIIVGGLRHGVQRFDSREAGRNATMLLMAIFGLVLPAVYANSDPDAIRIEEVSLVVAAALLVIYFAYIAYSFRAEGADPAIAKEMRVGAPDGHGEAMDEAPRASMSRTAALIMLGVATVATVVLSETLVGEVEAVVKTFGISEFFIGAIVVPLVGNVAEHFSAVTFASKNKLDITLGIAAGSSTQVALHVAPALVFLSLFLGPAPRSLANGMNLVFLPLEIVAVTASGLLFNYISNDGETNWLEGVQLVSLYLIIAAIFFLLQMPVATGH
ncbi:MAG: calcium/proton exchanger [Anaerolineae bacterium]|nr:calcium/proton exchanger [Anaerolineae bacterium]